MHGRRSAGGAGFVPVNSRHGIERHPGRHVNRSGVSEEFPGGDASIGEDNRNSGIRTAVATTIPAQRRSTLAGSVASPMGSRHSSAPIRLSLIPTTFGVMTDPFRCPARVKSSSPPSGSESALGRRRGRTRFWPRRSVQTVSSEAGAVRISSVACSLSIEPGSVMCAPCAVVVRHAPQGARDLVRPSSLNFQCAVKGAFSQWVRFPPGNSRSSR